MYKSVILIILFIAFSCNRKNVKHGDVDVKFDYKKLDVGEIKYKSLLKCMFKFENVGDNRIQIESVNPSCTCISAKWTKTIIFPNDTGNVIIMPNTGRLGDFKEAVVIYYKNIEFTDTLYISGSLVYEY